ncbi:MAG: methyltransferase domain-containing protein [Moraxellaceae bacterium]|nr:methyltransferase domain-containing protein [Moraxellaceae bacterium]
MDLPRLFKPEPRTDLQKDFRQWFATDLGSYLLAEEDALLTQVLPDLFGYHALQIGQVVPRNLLISSRIRHCCIVDAALPVVEGLSPLRAEPEHLPFANNSLDLVLIHHGLDGAASPHALLREASRVLIPEGHLLILGFNPWSLWGVWRLFRLPWGDLPWLRRPLSPQRLADWLTLLDFEVVGLESAGFAPPLTHDTIRRRFAWLETLGRRYWSQRGASYALLARKRLSCITPIEPRLRRRFASPAPVLVTEARSRRVLPDEE